MASRYNEMEQENEKLRQTCFDLREDVRLLKKELEDEQDKRARLAIDKDNVIRFMVNNSTQLTIDEEGIEYRGTRIVDCGEAHRCFVEMMRMMTGIGEQRDVQKTV